MGNLSYDDLELGFQEAYCHQLSREDLRSQGTGTEARVVVMGGEELQTWNLVSRQGENL